jgi:hypothetical protein
MRRIVDKALYYAKKTGKNKLSLLQKEPSFEVERDAKITQDALTSTHRVRNKSRFVFCFAGLCHSIIIRGTGFF